MKLLIPPLILFFFLVVVLCFLFRRVCLETLSVFGPLLECGVVWVCVVCCHGCFLMEIWLEASSGELELIK